MREETTADVVAAGEAQSVAGNADGAEGSSIPKRWYVVHTYSGHENKVARTSRRRSTRRSVKDHFGQILVATEEVAEMKDGKKTITTRKFFPSYVLIEMEMSDEVAPPGAATCPA